MEEIADLGGVGVGGVRGKAGLVLRGKGARVLGRWMGLEDFVLAFGHRI